MAAGTTIHQKHLTQAAAATSVVHRLAPQVKLIALVGFVCCVVATPAAATWPYLAQLAVLGVAVIAAGLKPAALLRGLAIELPFVAFALALPLIATGPTVEVAGLKLSVAGLWGAWTLLAKSTLSVLAALTLAGTTQPHEFVAGLQRLRLPSLLVEILGFMIRYLEVILAQWHRMSIARASRGFQPRNLRSWPALSGAVGAGFIRSFERGERVHLAMLSRGYTGELPNSLGIAVPARRWQWVVALIWVATSASVALIARGL